MNHPRIYIKSNGEKVNGYGKHDTNVSWTVAFLPFDEPASAYSGDRKKLSSVSSPIVVGNDCIAIDISNNKNSFAKTCSLTLKVTDTWYQSRVNPGDWVFVWISDSQQHQDEIQHLIKNNNFSNQRLLNGFKSGLKFVGRVLYVSSSDSVSESGHRSLTQAVHCQAFLELASSVYSAQVSASIFDRNSTTPSGKSDDQDKAKAAANFALRVAKDSLNNGSNFLTDFAKKFESLYQKGEDVYSPDRVIGWLFAITMGVDRLKNPRNHGTGELRIDGTFNDAIIIPSLVDKLLGNRGATRLCQIYHIILGLHQYKKLDGNEAQKLNPELDFKKEKGNNTNPVIYTTYDRCKGFVPFYPPSWDNTPIWNIFTPFLNPVLNEMYTALRINQDGIIMPTLIVREIPLSTGLYWALKEPRLYPQTIQSSPKSWKDKDKETQAMEAEEVDQIIKSKTFEPTKEYKSTSVYGGSTYFGNLPRWVIDESMILSINTNTNESERVNFVQVWGTNSGLQAAGATSQSMEAVKASQINMGNYRADVADIQRHGLRAQFFSSSFDTNKDGTSQTPDWARRRADWMFNGHLKLRGSITCIGIEEPICEGDNVEVRGILYHIESVKHTAKISSSGRKDFITTLQVSNGLIASSVNSSDPPSYATHLPKTRVGNPSAGFSYETNEQNKSKPDSEEESH